jgi:hypothetical protein
MISNNSVGKEYSDSTYVSANFGNERRNLFEEEPITIDPNADSDDAFVPIDSTSN